MAIYPDAVHNRLARSENAAKVEAENATGASASFLCGCVVKVTLRIDETGIRAAGFRTNGCGYMTAAADVLTGWLRGKALTDLHGTDTSELIHLVADKLGGFPADRLQCAEVGIDAIRAALAAYRSQLIQEFRGETALICTCFGVSEDAVVAAITDNDVKDVDDVSRLCRAGSGCGSCRMLISELIDAQVVD